MSLFPNERLSGAAQSVLNASTSTQMNYGFEYFADYLYAPGNLLAVNLADLSTAYWGSGTGQLFTRGSWTQSDAAYASFSCGPYTESHAHMDQGAFQIYRSEWLAPTSNIYSHSGIEGIEEHNNLLRFFKIDGTELHQGGTAPDGSGACQMQALQDTSGYTFAVARLTPVYASHAEVSQVEREFLFIKPATFVVFDRVSTATALQRVWNLNLPPALVDASITQFLHVLGTQGSVVSAVRSDATGQTGVQITLDDGLEPHPAQHRELAALVPALSTRPGPCADLPYLLISSRAYKAVSGASENTPSTPSL